MNGHRTAELRSIALHCAIAERLDAKVVARARVRLASHQGAYRDRWLALLDRSIEEVAAALVRDDDEMRAMRQATPFTFVIDSRERWRIWRATG